MAETAKYPVETKLGCGIMGGIFPSCRNFWQRKTSSVPSLPTNNTNITIKVPAATTHNSKNRRRGSSGETAFLESSNFVKTLPKPSEATRTSTSSNRLRRELRGFSPELNGMITPKPSEATRMSISSSSVADLNNRLPKEVSSISPELYGMIINDHPKQSNGSGALIRSTSNNVMLLGHLGNLRAQFPPGPSSRLTHKIGNGNGNGKLGGNGTMGNIVRKVAAGNENQQTRSWNGGLMMNRILDPEVLKCMGNEEYKVGRFEEALSLYNKAIALDSSKASYHSNKGAALTGLGRLIEAVFECREAIRIEPYYHRAHHRLATLYLRLGEAEKALCHYKYSSPKPDSEYIAQAQALQTHLSRCTEARKLRDWNTLLKETQCAMSSGADSAPEIYAWQAEALLKLHRHQEAYFTFRNGPNFDLDAWTQIFGPARTCYLLMIRAQLYMAMGRFEDATAMAQQAARLDSSNKEVSAVSRRIRVVASARLRGNQLFKASKFSEACVVYSEGLEHDPYNSLLLCNRAACRSKLGQFEKAVEDCTAALDVQPSYSKARLRRADCNAKLERWEASIQDYEMLKRESPGDEEVSRALFMAQIQLKKQRGEDVKDMKFGSNLFSVSSNERFRFFVTSPGMSVVLFCNKTSHKQAFQLLEQICKRFPSVNFLKVEVEDHPYLAKSEGVSSIPAFKIYKNGSRVKEISGNNRELLESSVKLYSN